MKKKQEATELVDSFVKRTRNKWEKSMGYKRAKDCAIIATKNKYPALRELLFNLRSCGVIVSETVYLTRLQKLIKEEMEVLKEIEKL